MEKLIIIGAGGYAKSVIDAIDTFNYEVVGFIDQFSDEKEHLGFPILAKDIELMENRDSYFYFIAIGNNKNRKRWYDKIKDQRLRLINVVDKTAVVAPTASIGEGCFIGKMAVVNSRAVVENDCIINTKALVEHGCIVHAHANISTNSVINGDVEVGEGSFLGSSSVTIGQIRIGCWSSVGAGAVVTRDVENGVTVAGIPAHIIKRKAMLG